MTPKDDNEPLRVGRRLIDVRYAAMAFEPRRVWRRLQLPSKVEHHEQDNE